MAFLELLNLSKIFKSAVGVQSFNLTVDRGEFVSFLGPSGCGKTTTLRMIAGFETPTTGTISIDNEDVTFKPPNQRNIGMVFQAYALFPNMTVGDNIGFGLKIAKKTTEEIKQRVNEMLQLIHMDGYGGRYPYQLSGGQQQRVALARALAVRPEVLLLDEPLSALDAKIRVSLRQEIRAIQQKLVITAIYVTHDQEEALSLSDRVVVMLNGHIEQVGAPFEIYNFPQTEFVAQFVGTLNTLNTVVRDPAAGILAVDGQHVQVAHSLEANRSGDSTAVALRPERLSFAAEARKANVLACQVETITFLGSIVRVQLSLGEQSFYMDTFNNPYLELPKIGDTVEITFSQEAVLVLNPQGSSQYAPPVA
ncbi:MAG: spermidine/putrescine ABC transporter ATP-binding protein [Chloroflexi bacterium RBG_16_54_18]|nr:MAG: spermidine/putrescine ABC transporter ATP-binding protein [Chloroflexi bacterium RBG_16_54_18]